MAHHVRLMITVHYISIFKQAFDLVKRLFKLLLRTNYDSLCAIAQTNPINMDEIPEY
jgi:hypothetical protein